MTPNIIVQVVLAIIFAGGIAGLIKMPGKQKIIAAVIMIIIIVASLLIWLG